MLCQGKWLDAVGLLAVIIIFFPEEQCERYSSYCLRFASRGHFRSFCETSFLGFGHKVKGQTKELQLHHHCSFLSSSYITDLSKFHGAPYAQPTTAHCYNSITTLTNTQKIRKNLEKTETLDVFYSLGPSSLGGSKRVK